MGNLTGTEDVHLPRYVEGLGLAMAECSHTHRVHLARRSNDTDTRRVLSFSLSDRGRFIAALALDKKKYFFDITPRDDTTFLTCGNAVVHAIKDYAPELLLEGEELFSPPPVNIFVRDKKIDTSSHQSITPLSDEQLPDNNHIPHEDTPIPDADKQTTEPFTAPADIWNPRTLALYHASLEWIFGPNDPSEYLLIDDHHGKIRALTEKMTSYFSAAAGSVHRALDPLRQCKVIEKEVTADNTPTSWWIVRFVANAPLVKEELKTLWDSRKNKQGKPLTLILSASPSPDGATVPIPEPLDTHIQNDQHDQPRENDTHASASDVSDEFTAKVEMLRTLQASLHTDVHVKMNSLYETIAEFCRKKNEELVRQQERFTDFLTTQDTSRVQNISTLLKRIAEIASQEAQ